MTGRLWNVGPVGDREYANTDCPYCHAALDPLPRARRRCPACRQPISIRLGPDGLTYLLQTGDLPVLDEAWAAHHEARRRAEFHEARQHAKLVANPGAARQDSASAPSDLHDPDVRIAIVTADDACAECRKFRGQVFEARAAPVLPFTRCRHVACRCDYLAVND